MLSLIKSSTFILHHQYPYPHFKLSSICPTISILKFRKNGVMSKNIATLKYIVDKDGVNGRENSICCRCMKIESEMNLEGMMLEFMEKSDKPDKFPTKKELISAGRFDLVEAISLRGGWFSLGWEVDDEASSFVRVEEGEIEQVKFDARKQRAGFHYTEFEAAEILYHHGESERRARDNEIVSFVNDKESENHCQVICQDQVCTVLQLLESEMSSALHLLRSFRKGFYPTEVSEFQENEVMSSQERLRYIRETKIFFPSSASEILLVGSFDDWATQRRMEKSSSGIFSASLELYPGRYEIKFIVDGIWRVDPLRPIVRNNGIKNNLLIIT